jgi:exopolysaccharide production protein ExoZ
VSLFFGVHRLIEMFKQLQIRKYLQNLFEPVSSRERLLAMEGLRGFAAILVFFVHFDALFRPYLRLNPIASVVAGVAGSLGHTGVDLFFVLSGFLIYGIVIQKNPTYRNFIWRRIRRLYPVFLLVLSFYLALSAVFPANSKLPPSLPHRLTYIGANLLMLPGMINISPIITVSWSLSYEWFFYLTIPLLVATLGLRRWLTWQRIAFFIFIAIAGYVLWFLGMAGHIRLIMFAAGIILWEVVNKGIPRALPRRMEYVVAATFVVSLLAIGVTGSRQGDTVLVLSKLPFFYAPLLFVSLPLFCLYAMFFDGFLARIFSWDYLRWMGNISYSYYLIHGLALHGLQLVLNRFFPPAPRWGLFCVLLLLVSVSLTIVCGALLFIIIEKPFSWTRSARSYAGGSAQ